METKDRIKMDVNLTEFPESVASLVPDLMETFNYPKKKEARRALVHMGKEVIPEMNELLKSKIIQLRRESAKILALIGDEKSICTFIWLLDDENSSIRWIAAEGLIHVGRESIEPLLEIIFRKADAYFIKQGAHHVFNRLFTDEEKNTYRPLLLSLNRYNNVAITAPIEAYNAFLHFRSHVASPPSYKKVVNELT